jgi:hypothetical protein
MVIENSKNGKRAGGETPEGQDAAGGGQQAPEPRAIRKPDRQRMQMLRNLPLEIKQSLTKEEADAFLYESTWPDSLLHKLKDYLVEKDAH